MYPKKKKFDLTPHTNIRKRGIVDKNNEQDALFYTILESIYQHQNNISSTYQVIIYRVNVESGLGNVIIGLVSSIIAAVATNRGIQSGSFCFLLICSEIISTVL